VSGGWITQADRARWQHQVALALAAILGDCGGLPLIAWMVAPAGLALSARVPGPAPARQVRAALAAWREAPGLQDYREWPGGGGTTRLYAAGTRGEVGIRISASVLEEETR
jgi:hypothetical protein